jgi:hypothetical protein
MQTYFRRLVAHLAGLDVLTHALPFEARVEGRRSGRMS